MGPILRGSQDVLSKQSAGLTTVVHNERRSEAARRRPRGVEKMDWDTCEWEGSIARKNQ